MLTLTIICNAGKKRGGSIFSGASELRFYEGDLPCSDSKRKGFICELLVDDEVAAQQFGFIDGETAVAYRIGMDDRFSKYSPGPFARMDHGTLRDKGIRSIDLGKERTIIRGISEVARERSLD